MSGNSGLPRRGTETLYDDLTSGAQSGATGIVVWSPRSPWGRPTNARCQGRPWGSAWLWRGCAVRLALSRLPPRKAAP